MLERMSLRANVEIVQQSDAEADEDDERSLVLNIVGDDLGMLIGRQNETLSALEFITRLMTNQQTHTRTGFVVDVNGHRAKRAESLRKLALRMADQTVQTGRTVAMEPMPPAERRIVHLALRDHPSVTTQSVGEGDRRKVTIVPKEGRVSGVSQGPPCRGSSVAGKLLVDGKNPPLHLALMHPNEFSSRPSRRRSAHRRPVL